ncbi:formyltetrahydrofolate deformylase [Reichenbachiella sp. MALMAid0571]|uniref:formyltetrahydrofolate deformylase n=1 Tax=Reichenbachiella sp. MALMAid0571 TaxID=3143939 RepID=UPI0032DFCE0D
MNTDKNTQATLLLSGPDQVGLVSRISNFVFENGGNIINLHEHVDPIEKIFSVRVSWEMRKFKIPAQDVEEFFAPIAESMNAQWQIRFSGNHSRVAIFVSKYDHCLLEILWRHKNGEYPIDIPLVISNHADLKPLADQYGIPYFIFPITKENKKEQEEKELSLLREHNIDTLVLARYMQVLSEDFVSHYPNNIINIHHSFLPAFIGGNPYKQAYERGVKIIGATSHFVTKDIDEGPIIEQDITRISHRDTTRDLIRKGRDLERMVLAKAIHYYAENRILMQGKKTIIFQ